MMYVCSTRHGRAVNSGLVERYATLNANLMEAVRHQAWREEASLPRVTVRAYALLDGKKLEWMEEYTRKPVQAAAVVTIIH